VYAGVRTKKGIADATAEIVKAFPGWSNEQTDILKDRFAENNFTDERMLDSVNHVIDTFVYGSIPNIAHFIQFDKKVQIYSWNELEKLHNDGNANKSDYGMILVSGKVRYCKNEEIDRFKLERHIPKSSAESFVPPPIDMSKFEGKSVEQMMQDVFNRWSYAKPEI
jgi:hypothetical protein